MPNNKLTAASTRRKFLGGAAVAGVATIAMPQVSRAQTVTLKMQSGFGATDILSDYGRDYVAKVNEMGGGRLKIDFLNSGAVVKPFSVMDATHSGVLDGNYSVPAYWYGKHRAASLFGTGPV
ncbi:MAG: twin-arginine translocation signal domain-containing protein, partial [Pseudolabrys sp.]